MFHYGRRHSFILRSVPDPIWCLTQNLPMTERVRSITALRKNFSVRLLSMRELRFTLKMFTAGTTTDRVDVQGGGLCT